MWTRTPWGSDDSTLLPEEADARAPSPLPLPDRYVEQAVIGVGGMGKVYRVDDRVLGRAVAMKVLRDDRSYDGDARRRFLEEARVTAQLQHPGIVPVYDLGRLPDGRAYYTMREVRGRTLAGIIQAVHAAAGPTGWPPTADGWTLRRLVEAFARACEAIAYAHQRGVVHRDLKPTNLLVGEFGDLQVVDWGIARVLGQPADVPEARAAGVVRRGAAWETRDGDVLGTPAYMAPEQARGDVEDIGCAADVYALGGILREILTGRPPWQGAANAVIFDIQAGLRPLANLPPDGPPVPAELVAVADIATRLDPAERYPNAAALFGEVSDWLRGARRRDEALAIVAEADAQRPITDGRRTEARALRARAEALLDTLPALAPESERLAAWALEDEAQRLEIETNVDEARWLQTLQSALQIVPDLAEARARLAEHYRDRLVAAEEHLDVRAAAALESLVHTYDDGRNTAWLRGDARIEVPVDPPDARCVWHRVVERNRRLVAEPVADGRGLEADLTRGSWIAELSAPGRATIRYPVQLGRGETFTGIAPGDRSPTAIRLPDADALGPDDVWIPPGRGVFGGDPEAADAWPRRVAWLDGYVIRRNPVSTREYLAFLDAVAAEEGLPRALSFAPRSWPDNASFVAHRDGRFVETFDRTYVTAGPNEPIAWVSATDADAYAAWWSSRTGRAWRLPTGVERERAGRGADGRSFPWGNSDEPGRSCNVDAFATTPARADLDAFPDDSSPYGVRHLIGNVRDWCGNDWSKTFPATTRSGAPDAIREVRGGAYSTRASTSRLAGRYGAHPDRRYAVVGFRLARY